MNDKVNKLEQRAQSSANLGRVGEQEAYFQQILSQDCNHLDALIGLAQIRVLQNRNILALALLKKANFINSTNLQVKVLLAEITWGLGETAQSSQYWQEALDLEPNNAYALLGLSNQWFVSSEFEKSHPYIVRAALLEPENPMVCVAMAKSLHNLRHLDDAEPWFQKAVSLMPEQKQYQWEYAMQLMLQGEFSKGWQMYESRFSPQVDFANKLNCYPFPFTRWEGQSLDGKVLLVHGEQGLGDEIMAASLYNDLRLKHRKAKAIYIACSPSLYTLFERSFPHFEVVEHNRSKLEFERWQTGGVPDALLAMKEDVAVDYQIPMFSLGQYLRPDMDSFITSRHIKDNQGYLVADKKKVSKFKKKIKEKLLHNKYKVGLMWQANQTTGEMGSNKSIDVQLLNILANTHCDFISLQNFEYGRDYEKADLLSIVDFCNEINDFDDTVALIECCDLVISVDTSVCHLSASLNKQTWVPLRFAADWRYVYDLQHCVWYNSMTLFRQQDAGDWETVLKEIAAKLNKVSAQKS